MSKLRLFLNMLAVAAVMSLCVSCAGLSGKSGASAVPSVPRAAADVLAPTELVEVKVFGEQELTTSARISDDGRIAMPMIGDIQIGGLTVQAATRLIRERLTGRFIANPQVTLNVIEHAKKMFTVLGEVKRAGTYRFPDQESINLIQAIGIAGSYTAIGDPTRITLKRVVNGKPEVFKLDAKKMARDASVPVEIQPGDIITVGERLF